MARIVEDDPSIQANRLSSMWSIRMDKAVARLNIEHYRKLLAKETDQTKRETLGRLLAEEVAKMAALTDMPDTKQWKR